MRNMLAFQEATKNGGYHAKWTISQSRGDISMLTKYAIAFASSKSFAITTINENGESATCLWNDPHGYILTEKCVHTYTNICCFMDSLFGLTAGFVDIIPGFFLDIPRKHAWHACDSTENNSDNCITKGVFNSIDYSMDLRPVKMVYKLGDSICTLCLIFDNYNRKAQ